MPVTPPNVVHLTPYVADSFGYFKDENLTVELVRFEGGVGSLRASASGGITLAGLAQLAGTALFALNMWRRVRMPASVPPPSR